MPNPRLPTLAVVALGLIAAILGAVVGSGAPVGNHLSRPICAIPAGTSARQEISFAPQDARNMLTGVLTVTLSAYTRYGSVLAGQHATGRERADVIRCVFGVPTGVPEVVEQTEQTVTVALRQDYLPSRLLDWPRVSADGLRLRTRTTGWPSSTKLTLQINAPRGDVGYSRPPDEWAPDVRTWTWTVPPRAEVTVLLPLGAGERATAYLNYGTARSYFRRAGEFTVMVDSPVRAVLGWLGVFAMLLVLVVMLRHRSLLAALTLLTLPLFLRVRVIQERSHHVEDVGWPVAPPLLLVVVLLALPLLRRTLRGVPSSFPAASMAAAPLVGAGVVVWLVTARSELVTTVMIIDVALVSVLIWAIGVLVMTLAASTLGMLAGVLVPHVPDRVTAGLGAAVRRAYPVVATAVVIGCGCALGYGLASFVGTAVAAYRVDAMSLAPITETLAQDIGTVGVYPALTLLLPLVATFAAVTVTRRLSTGMRVAVVTAAGSPRPPMGKQVVGATGLAALAWAATSRSLGLAAVGTWLPVAAWLLAALIAVSLRRAVAAISKPGAAAPWLPPAPADPPPSDVLRRGPYPEVRKRVTPALTWASLLAVVPVSYLIWATTTTLTRDGTTPIEVFFGASQVVGETVRWLLTGWLYALLLPVLPGRIGPLKALWLATMWFAASLPMAVLNIWTGNDAGREWLFPGLQLLLFLTVLSVLMDLSTVRVWDRDATLSGAWSTVLEIYNIDGVRKLGLYAAPAIAAVIAIGEQVVTGTALEFVSSFLTGTAAFLGR